MKPDLIIVGAGLTGLTAAIEAAERGWRVTVAEAHSRPGGRARSLAAPFRANEGPHAIYVDGSWWAWLERRGLTPPIVEAPRSTGLTGATLVRAGGRRAAFRVCKVPVPHRQAEKDVDQQPGGDVGEPVIDAGRLALEVVGQGG